MGCGSSAPANVSSGSSAAPEKKGSVKAPPAPGKAPLKSALKKTGQPPQRAPAELPPMDHADSDEEDAAAPAGQGQGRSKRKESVAVHRQRLDKQATMVRLN